MSLVKHPLVVISTFLWIGFVCAISFLEAWLKFSAPGVTIAIGLGIGRLVFGALNKVELVFCVAILFHFVSVRKDFTNYKSLYFLVPMLLLLTQTFWLLPVLDVRAEMYINQAKMAPSNLHLYYVVLEVIKVAGLTLFGISLFKEP